MSNSVDCPHLNTTFSVYPSIQNLVRLDRNSYSQQLEPYSSCSVLADNTLTVPIANQAMFDLTFRHGFTYTQQLCMFVCLQEWIAKIWNCNSYLFLQHTVSTFSQMSVKCYSWQQDLRVQSAMPAGVLQVHHRIRSIRTGNEQRLLVLTWKREEFRLCSRHAQRRQSQSVYIWQRGCDWYRVLFNGIYRNQRRTENGLGRPASWVDTCTYFLAWTCLVLSKLSNYLRSWQLIIFGIH